MKWKAAPFPGASSARAAFTLMELLVVIAIIAILAALLLQTAGYVNEKAARSRAEGEIRAIETALEAYKVDNGTYPQQENGKSTESTKPLLDALNPKDETEGDKIYFEIPLKMMDSYSSTASAEEIRGKAKYLVDPFGKPYHYQFPGDPKYNGPAFFDLWSEGKKNNADEKFWIKNW